MVANDQGINKTVLIRLSRLLICCLGDKFLYFIKLFNSFQSKDISAFATFYQFVSGNCNVRSVKMLTSKLTDIEITLNFVV